MAFKSGDFVELDFVARVKESGEIFDLTDEKLAKDKGIYNSKIKYSPIKIILGAGYILKGLDAELQKMSSGETKKIVIQPADAFGNRDPRLIRTFSMTEFKAQGVTPRVGQVITLQKGLNGRILSVSSGRVQVDFNHPLAGKVLEYDIKINRPISDTAEQIISICEFFVGLGKDDLKISFETAKEGKAATIEMLKMKDIPNQTKARIADEITKYVANIKDVRFVESFKKEQKTAKNEKDKSKKAEK